MTEQRVLKTRIKPNHPDYEVLCGHLNESRRLFNSLVAVSREANAYYKNPTADTHISKELGLLEWVKSNPFLGNFGCFEKIRKQVEIIQGIHLPHLEKMKAAGTPVKLTRKAFNQLLKDSFKPLP